MTLTDAHLDLAYNALRGRAVLQPAREQIPDIQGIPSVGLPDLRAGNVGLICATIFCQPDLGADKGGGYRTVDEANRTGWEQLHWYERQFEYAQLRLVIRRDDPALADEVTGRLSNLDPIPTILLIEGADPIRSADELPKWFDAGVRMIGLAWQQTRYAGGTAAPGPLTDEGINLIAAMDRLGMIHDLSHLAEQSFWQLLDQSGGPVAASHSNCRALIPTDRHLSDPMIRAIASRGGMIGINFFDRFLLPTDQQGKRRANLADVVRQVDHLANLLGGTQNIGLGTDMDGGLGRDQIPVEITTSADLPRVGDALADGGYSDDDILGILGRNWRRYFARTLPM